MKKELVYLISSILGAGAVTLLCWPLLGVALRVFAKQKTQKSRDIYPGFIDADIEKRREIEKADMGVRIAMSRLIATPILFGAAYIVLNLTGTLTVGSAALGLVAECVLLCGYAFIRYKGSLRDREELRWYHEAKTMVDRAIAPLVPRGYIVFRDFKADDISIDHLLIGPKGVFALQTLVRSANLKQGQPTVPMATYDGRALFFPQGEDHMIVERAEKNAEDISEWISKRVGMPIAARAIVALPGWQVKRTSAQGISVINPAQLEALFQYIKPWPLSEDILFQIVRLVENHYGDTTGGIPIETVAGEGLPS
jgi:hypothetical protein